MTSYDDHCDLLTGQNALSARKISPGAQGEAALGQLYVPSRDVFRVSDEGRCLFEFLTGRGHVGRCFAPRFWEHETSFERERGPLIVACKKWRLAERFVGSIKHHTDIAVVDHLPRRDGRRAPPRSRRHSGNPR